MEVKINKDIREFTESIFFGLSMRQFIFSLLACIVAVILYFAFKPFFGIETLSWMCILGAAPFAVLGFVKYNGMTAEKFVMAWVKSQILSPKRLYFKSTNFYYEIYKEDIKLLKVYANSDNPINLRNNAIIHLFLNCGLRLSELANLDILDFDLNENKFLIFGKGSKERIGYLNKTTKDALLEYLKYRKNIGGINSKHDRALFLSNEHKRISVSRVQKIVLKAFELANLDDRNFTTHTLRHTCATLLYRNGTDIKVIQELLGHVQIDTTEIYTHLHNKQVMDAMLGHPMANFMMSNALSYSA